MALTLALTASIGRMGGGVLCVVLGMGVLIGWHAGIPVLVQVHPAFVPMQYNTALGFVLGGAGLLCAIANRHLSLVAGVVTSLVGILTLIQYVFGVNLGIDELLMTHTITVETSHPGRMAPNTALCFALTGAGLLVPYIRADLTARLVAQGLIGSAVGALGTVALLGYWSGIETAYGWGHLTRMAVHTAGGFLILSSGMLAFALDVALRSGRSSIPWLSAHVFALVATASVCLWQALVARGGGQATYLAEAALVVGLALALLTAATVRLAQTSRRRADHVTRLASHQEALLGISRSVLDLQHPSDLSDVSRKTLSELQVIVPHAQTMALHRILSEEKGTVQTIRVSADGEVSDIARRKVTQILRDWKAQQIHYEPDLAASDPEGVQRLKDRFGIPIRSVLNVPFSRGVFCVHSVEPHAFREEDIALVRQAVDIFTVGIARVEDLAATEAHAEALAAANAQMRKENDERRKAEERLQNVLESAPNGVVVVDDGGSIQLVNRRTEELFGYNRDELRGKDVELLVPESSRGSHVSDRKAYQAGGQSRRMGQGRELFAQRKDGTTFPVEVALTPVDTPEGPGVLAVVMDITERRRAETRLDQTLRELETRAVDLQRSNEDLQQFAYAASHDMQEPLRMVSGYLQLIERRYADRLDEDGLEFIDFAVDGSVRMQAMIRGILEFSKVRSQPLSDEEVDFEDLFQGTTALLRTLIEESGAEVVAGSLPTVRGDATLLGQLLQNLIGNAIKFRSEETPRVRVSARHEEDAWLLSVEDNGIGIDARYHDQIFDLFKRLHSVGDYPGSGIGLAMCRRIVEHHGGRINVASVPGRGSTFSFTIPDARPLTGHRAEQRSKAEPLTGQDHER